MLAIQLQKVRNAGARDSQEELGEFAGHSAGGREERAARGVGSTAATAGEPGSGAHQRPRGEAAARLGAELRRLRLDRGLSQRRLTRLIGLSAHSNLGEYERGNRVPPLDIVTACERLLAVPPGHLQQLQEEARRERARARRRAAAARADA